MLLALSSDEANSSEEVAPDPSGLNFSQVPKKVKYSSQSRAVKEKLNKQTKDLCWSTLEQDYERRVVRNAGDADTDTHNCWEKYFLQ